MKVIGIGTKKHQILHCCPTDLFISKFDGAIKKKEPKRTATDAKRPHQKPIR
jgi:hypothetical protein